VSKLTAGKRRFVKRALGNARPTIWVGKDGPSEDLVKEIERQLSKNEMVKVKILKSAIVERQVKEIALGIVEKTGSTLVEVRGHTLMLYKHRKK
jgi:RNA-binding protein